MFRYLLAVSFLTTAALPAYAGCPKWLYAVGQSLANVWLGKPDPEAVRAMLQRDSVPWEEVRRAYRRLDPEDAGALTPDVARAGMRHERNSVDAAQLLVTRISPPDLLGTATGAIAQALAVETDGDFQAATMFFCAMLNGPSGFYLIGQEPLAERSSLQRRRLLTLALAVVLARGYDSSALPWSSLEANGNDDVGSLLRWTMVTFSGGEEMMGTQAIGALTDVLPRLPAVAREKLLEVSRAKVNARALASFLPKLILEEEHPGVWEAAMASFVGAMEAIAEDETERALFAASAGFRYIESMPQDIRSRRLRSLHGFIDMSYDTLPKNPPYLNRYNDRLDRIDAARAKIRASGKT